MRVINQNMGNMNHMVVMCRTLVSNEYLAIKYVIKKSKYQHLLNRHTIDFSEKNRKFFTILTQRNDTSSLFFIPSKRYY